MAGRTVSEFGDHLSRSYREIGALEADIVFLYTDLRTFGQDSQNYPTRDAFFEAILQPLLARGQTVLVPTFTYTTQGVFDVETTPSRLGAINKWIIGRPNVQRSEHPLFSVAAIGPKADLVMDIGKSAFGAESIFERLIGQNAAFLHVGRPVAVGNTCVHYVEQACGATYRYHKAFETEVFRGDICLGNDYSAFVRRRDVANFDFDFKYRESAEVLAKELDIKETGLNSDFTNLSLYDYDGTIEYFTRSFYNDPSIFIRGKFLERE